MEKEAEKKSKQKQRDKISGKTNKIDIDYQILHDAFFRYQTKPVMSRAGELYYEGKEFEVQVREKRPGFLSDSLKVSRRPLPGPTCTQLDRVRLRTRNVYLQCPTPHRSKMRTRVAPLLRYSCFKSCQWTRRRLACRRGARRPGSLTCSVTGRRQVIRTSRCKGSTRLFQKGHR